MGRLEELMAKQRHLEDVTKTDGGCSNKMDKIKHERVAY